jgi:Transposase and inactivated derivatives
VVAERSGQRKKRINLFCGLNSRFEPIAPYLTEENCRSTNFEQWFESKLLLTIPPDSVIIMDNAKFHRKAVLFERIKTYNSWYGTQLKLIFLPPYSPDFNPIEHFFAVLKGKVKRLAHTGKSVVERLHSVLEI